MLINPSVKRDAEVGVSDPQSPARRNSLPPTLYVLDDGNANV